MTKKWKHINRFDHYAVTILWNLNVENESTPYIINKRGDKVWCWDKDSEWNDTAKWKRDSIDLRPKKQWFTGESLEELAVCCVLFFYGNDLTLEGLRFFDSYLINCS